MAKQLEGSLSMTDLFHQQEVTIDGHKLIFFLSKASIWDHVGIEKDLYESFADEKNQAMLFQYYNELYKWYYNTGKSFFVFFFFKKMFFFISLFFRLFDA